VSAGVYRYIHSKRQLGAPALALAGRRTDAQIGRQLYSAVPGRRNRVVATLAPALGQFLSRLQELSWLLAISGTWFQNQANNAKSRHSAAACGVDIHARAFSLQMGCGGLVVSGTRGIQCLNTGGGAWVCDIHTTGRRHREGGTLVWGASQEQDGNACGVC